MDPVNNITSAIKRPCQSNLYHGPLVLNISMIIEMIVGLPTNIIALWIFCFCMKRWKPHTFFLFNLVLADFLLLGSVPFRIDSYLRGEHWVFGEIWCRVNLFMLAVNRSASIAFMTTVALDRYIKVVYPHHWISRMTLRQSGWLAGLMWIVVIALRIPLLATNLLRQKGNASWCRSFDTYDVVPLAIKVHIGAFVAEFFLPWFLLLFCSIRIACFLNKRQIGKQKKVRMSIRAVGVISLVFTICFLPSIATGLGAVVFKSVYPEDCKTYDQITSLFMISIGFTYLNSALDPVIYIFSSSMFRDALRSFIGKLGFVKKNRTASNTDSNF